MRYPKHREPAPWTIKIGFWLALAAYLVSFVLPAQSGGPAWGGAGLFFWGICGVVMTLGHPPLVVFLLPWLANPFLWFALINVALGNGRAALRMVRIAALLALSHLLVSDFSTGVLGLFFGTSPAYFAWLGSIVLFMIFSSRLARHHEQQEVLWDVDTSDEVTAQELCAAWPNHSAASSDSVCVSPSLPAPSGIVSLQRSREQQR